MIKPTTEFTCQIEHHGFDTADVLVTQSSDGVVVEIGVCDRHPDFSTANSRIRLTDHELAKISDIVARYNQARIVMEEE